jgi:hypothetical protein
MLGNFGSERSEKTTKIHDLKLKGEFKTCEQCAIVKASEKHFKKTGRVEVKTWRAIIL